MCHHRFYGDGHSGKGQVPESRIGTVYISALLLTDQYNLKDIDAYSLEVSSLNAELVICGPTCKGKKVYAWTADTEKSIDAILYIQADGIVMTTSLWPFPLSGGGQK